jgi:ABC-type lipoprotein release transport system permease subunit
MTAALIMSGFLITSSFATTVLIPHQEFEEGGQASGRALAYLAHQYLGNGFGTAYDLSTISILWFAGASAIGLASTMSANILDRTREYGVMHAIGARPKAVRRIVVAEGVFLALASLLVAALPALGLTAVLGVGLGNLFFSAPLPYRFSVPAVGIWAVLVVLGAVLATEAAATRASRLTVREALTYL